MIYGGGLYLEAVKLPCWWKRSAVMLTWECPPALPIGSGLNPDRPQQQQEEEQWHHHYHHHHICCCVGESLLEFCVHLKTRTPAPSSHFLPGPHPTHRWWKTFPFLFPPLPPLTHMLWLQYSSPLPLQVTAAAGQGILSSSSSTKFLGFAPPASFIWHTAPKSTCLMIDWLVFSKQGRGGGHGAGWLAGCLLTLQLPSPHLASVNGDWFTTNTGLVTFLYLDFIYCFPKAWALSLYGSCQFCQHAFDIGWDGWRGWEWGVLFLRMPD